MIRIVSNAEGLGALIRQFGVDARPTLVRAFKAWASVTNNMLKVEAEQPVKSGVRAKVVEVGVRPGALFECASMIGLWREQGTGIHGPLKRPIVSKGGMYLGPKPVYAGPRRRSGAAVRGVGAERPLRTRSVLRFEIDGKVIYRPSVAGRKADPWFWKTIQANINRRDTGLASIVLNAFSRRWRQLHGKLR